MSLNLADYSEGLWQRSTHFCTSRVLLIWLWWVQSNDSQIEESTLMSSLYRWNTLKQWSVKECIARRRSLSAKCWNYYDAGCSEGTSSSSISFSIMRIRTIIPLAVELKSAVTWIIAHLLDLMHLKVEKTQIFTFKARTSSIQVIAQIQSVTCFVILLWAM